MSQAESSEQAPQLPSSDMPVSDRSGSDIKDQKNEGIYVIIPTSVW